MGNFMFVCELAKVGVNIRRERYDEFTQPVPHLFEN